MVARRARERPGVRTTPSTSTSIGGPSRPSSGTRSSCRCSAINTATCWSRGGLQLGIRRAGRRAQRVLFRASLSRRSVRRIRESSSPGSSGSRAETPGERTALIELESIMRSLHGLPPHSATDDEAEREVRAHETFIAKRRLAELSRARAADHGANAPQRRDCTTACRATRETFDAAAPAARAPAVSARVLARGGRRDQLPAVLRHQRPRGAAHAKRGRARGDAPARCSQWVADGKMRDSGSIIPTACTIRAATRLAAQALTAVGAPDLYLVVEKILAAHEHLPRGWPVHGTTGYEFAFAVNGLFVHAPSENAEFDRVYRDFTQDRDAFDAVLSAASSRSCFSICRASSPSLANLLNRLDESCGSRPATSR